MVAPMMESFEGRQNSGSRHDSGPNANWGGGQSLVLVVIDANKELSTTAIDWALTHLVRSGDALRLLAILQHILNPSKGGFQAGLSKLGYKSRTDDSISGTNRSKVDLEISHKKQILLSNTELQTRCEKLNVKLDIDVKQSNQPRVLAVEEAKSFGAHHVVLDRCMKKDRKYFIDNLTCFVTRVRTIDDSEPLRPGLPSMNQGGNGMSNGDIMIDTSPSIIQSPVPTIVPGTLKPEPQPQPPMNTALAHRPASLLNHNRTEPEPEVEAANENLTTQNSDAMTKMGAGAVGQCFLAEGDDREQLALLDENSDHGFISIYPMEGSFQQSPLLSPVTEASSAGHTPFLSRSSSYLGFQPVSSKTQEMLSEMGTSSVTGSPAQECQPLSPNSPVTSMTELSTSSVATAAGYPGTAAVPRETCDSMEVSTPMTVSEAPLGPISVQPRRPWIPRNLDDLLNHANHQPQLLEKKSNSKEEVENQLVEQQGQDVKDSSHMQTPPTPASKNMTPMEIQGPLDRTSNVRRAVSIKEQQGQDVKDSSHMQTPPTPASKNMTPMEIQGPLDRTSSVRRAVSMKKQGPGAPPLCSVCNQKSPEFGKPVRKFTYAELQEATDNFSEENYLAEGGYGSVHKGKLKEGQLVAVKQHKIASSQGDQEFCSEVEVLSCAQHRNLVTLIGYCVEERMRLLVYEFVCNGSLDRHLSSKNKEGLQWKHRHKIALGAARALRYLHEECRVGCIVHRDMRPNNILLTHDFTSMVGDFGLARRQSNGETAEETRVIGTFGYLAPEYAETGQITDKADVYAFGVVLLELITGRKAIDHSRARGELCLTEWARPLLDHKDEDLVDPRLINFDMYEMHCMMHAANQCIRKDPTLRPRMTQVLRILDPSQDEEAPRMVSRKSTPDLELVFAATSEYIPTESSRSTSRSGPQNSFSDPGTRSQLSQSVIPRNMNRRQKAVKGIKSKTSLGERSPSFSRLSYVESSKDSSEGKETKLSYESMLES